MKLRRKKLKLKSYTIFISSSTSKPVTRFALPKFMLYSIPLFLITPLALLYYFYHLTEELKEENLALSSNLSQQVSKAKALENVVETMEETTSQAQLKMKELEILEAQIREYMLDLPDYIDPRGGINLPIDIDQESHADVEISSVDWESNKLVEKYRETIAEVEELNEELRFIPTAWPSKATRISSTFGGREDPFTTKSAFHTGIDLAAPWGTPVYAGADGTVTKAEYYGGYGKAIIIRHSNSYKTLYGHLSEIMVEVGDQVKKGDRIGSIGSTGRSTGPHLHYEIIKDGEPIDPFPYMDFFK